MQTNPITKIVWKFFNLPWGFLLFYVKLYVLFDARVFNMYLNNKNIKISNLTE